MDIVTPSSAPDSFGFIPMAAIASTDSKLHDCIDCSCGCNNWFQFMDYGNQCVDLIAHRIRKDKTEISVCVVLSKPELEKLLELVQKALAGQPEATKEPDEKEPFHPYPDAVEKHYCSYCDCEYYKLEDGTITPCCCTDDETIEQEEC